MTNLMSKAYIKKKSNKGFTLLELVIVMVVIGILSVTIMPKMFSTGGFDEIGYQSELITKLRSIQLRYMHNSTECNIALSDTKIELLIGNPCAVNDDPIYNSTKIVIEGDNLSFQRTSNSLSFNVMGRPNGGEFIISILGGEKLRTVTINSEGYIFASN
ncbi:MAG: type II secretion system protein [Colwellia sp.]|nr:type II secretion system protein [Colwellia sp.]